MNNLKKAKRLEETLAAEKGSDDEANDPEVSILQTSLKFS